MDTAIPLELRMDPYNHGLSSGSDDDVFSFFLGPAPTIGKQSAYMKRNVDKFNMPENYIGQNLYLRDTMEDWMFTANQTWYTERILPWVVTDQIKLQWTEMEANPHFLGITPHQATSQIVTQRRTAREASMLRRGIAGEFEHGFIKTPLGRTSFFASLGQMGRSVQETANAECIRTLLNSHRPQQAFIRQHGIVPDGDLDTYLERERDRFAISQKMKNGLVHLNTEIRKEQALWGGRSDVWILPEEMVSYTQLVPSHMVDYDKAGPRGPDRRDGLIGGIRPQKTGLDAGMLDTVEPMRMVHGTPAYVARSFYVDGIGKEDLLARTKQIGGYCTMFDENVDFSNYSSASRDIAVFNEDIDDFTKIRFSNFIRNCGLWDEQTGDLSHPGRGGRRNRRDRDDINRDLDRDFLTWVDDRTATPTRRNIQFIGDIAEEYFTTEDAENAGLTLLNAYRRASPDADGQIAQLEQFQANAKRLLGAEGAPNQAGAGVDAIAGAFDSLLGGRNLFLNNSLAQPGEDILQPAEINSPVHAFYRTFIATGGVPIVKDGSSTSPAQPRSTNILSPEAIGQGFLNSFKSKIPESQHERIDAIINGSGSALDRAQSIRDEMNRMVNENIEGYTYSNTRGITKLFNGLKKQYEQQLAATAESAAVPVASAVGSGDVERRLAYPGRTNLPAGWRYENPSHAQATSFGFRPSAPSSLDHVHVFNVQREVSARARSASASVQSTGGQTGSTGHGLAHIGRYNFGPNDEALREQRQRRRPAENDTELQARFKNLASRINSIATGSARPAVKTAAIMYLGARFNRDVFLNMYRHNIKICFGGFLGRPHATYRTRYAIKCLSNGGSGNTFFGHSDMQIEHDAARKMGMMHYTCYMASVVTQPRNVYVVPDVFCQDYLGGLGIGMWSPNEYRNRGDNHTAKSIICVVVPSSEKNSLPVKFDIAGRWYTHFNMGLVRQERFEELHYSTAFRYNQLYGFYDPLNRAREMGGPNFRAGDVGVNRVLWRDMQWNYNKKTDSFDKVRINQGHMGPNVYAGCGQVRKGKAYELKEMNYASFASN